MPNYATRVAEPLTSIVAELGESALWDARVERLRWVDVDGGWVASTHPQSGKTVRETYGSPLGGLWLAPANGLAVAVGRTIQIGSTSASEVHVTTLPLPRGLRINDGVVLPDGRLVISSVDLYGKRRAGTWLVDATRLVTLFKGADVTNGPAYDARRGELFISDTRARQVRRYRVEQGWRFDLVDIWPIREGPPDGLCVDAEGNLWVALWGAGAVHCYTPTGKLISIIRVPSPAVTSCAFGSDGVLYITTSRRGAAQSRPIAKHDGAVFCSQTTAEAAAFAVEWAPILAP